MTSPIGVTLKSFLSLLRRREEFGGRIEAKEVLFCLAVFYYCQSTLWCGWNIRNAVEHRRTLHLASLLLFQNNNLISKLFFEFSNNNVRTAEEEDA